MTLHNYTYRRSIHGSSRSWWNSRSADSAAVPRFAADGLGRRARGAGVLRAGQHGELSFHESSRVQLGCEWLLVVFLGSSSTMDPMVAGARGEREAMAVRNRRAANPAPSSKHAEEYTA